MVVITEILIKQPEWNRPLRPKEMYAAGSPYGGRPLAGGSDKDCDACPSRQRAWSSIGVL